MTVSVHVSRWLAAATLSSIRDAVRPGCTAILGHPETVRQLWQATVGAMHPPPAQTEFYVKGVPIEPDEEVPRAMFVVRNPHQTEILGWDPPYNPHPGAQAELLKLEYGAVL